MHTFIPNVIILTLLFFRGRVTQKTANELFCSYLNRCALGGFERTSASGRFAFWFYRTEKLNKTVHANVWEPIEHLKTMRRRACEPLGRLKCCASALGGHLGARKRCTDTLRNHLCAQHTCWRWRQEPSGRIWCSRT